MCVLKVCVVVCCCCVVVCCVVLLCCCVVVLLGCCVVVLLCCVVVCCVVCCVVVCGCWCWFWCVVCGVWCVARLGTQKTSVCRCKSPPCVRSGMSSPVIGRMTPGLQMLGGSAQRLILHGWFASPLNIANHPTHVVLDLGCTRSIGSRTAIERFKTHAWYYGITTEFCRCNKSSVFGNSETETGKESCIIHFPTIPPCCTKVDVLETGDVPILFSLSLR